MGNDGVNEAQVPCLPSEDGNADPSPASPYRGIAATLNNMKRRDKQDETQRPEKPASPWSAPKWTSSAPGSTLRGAPQPPTPPKKSRLKSFLRKIRPYLQLLALVLLIYIAATMATRRQIDAYFLHGGDGPASPCPNDLFVLNLEQRACYLFAHSPIGQNVFDWNQAEEYCRENSADLAHVRTEAEQQWINRFIRTTVNDDKMQYWLGAKREKTQSLGRWIEDGMDLISDGNQFVKWLDPAEGEPVSPDGKGRAQCLLLDKGGWKWDACSNEKPFICKALMGKENEV